MNWAHVHLLLNHIPVFGTLFGLLLLSVALWKKSDTLRQASLVCFLLIGMLGVFAFLTGEPAEEVVEHLPGVTETVIEEHEESALASLIALEALAAASLIGLFFSWKSNRIPSGLVIACLILSVVSLLAVAWTSHLGGQIRHTETRGEFQTPEEED